MIQTMIWSSVPIKFTSNNTMTDRIQCVFAEHGFVVNKKCRKNRFESVILPASIIQIDWVLIKYRKNLSLCVYFGAVRLSTCFVKYWTHNEYDWSVYCLVFCLICKFHWIWGSNRYQYGNRRILDSSLKENVTLLGKWYLYVPCKTLICGRFGHSER